MGELSKLPNVGPELERKLIRAEIETPDELYRVGAINAFMRIRAFYPSACLHMLYALEGAVRGVRKPDIPEVRKAELRQMFKSL